MKNKKKILIKKINYEKLKTSHLRYEWLNYYRPHYKNAKQYRHVIRTKWGYRRLTKEIDKIMEEN